VNANVGYEQRQIIPRWIIVLVAFVVGVCFAVAVAVPRDPLPWMPVAVAAITVVVTWGVSSLRIRVDARGVTWSFAWGWPGGRVGFAEIANVEAKTIGYLEQVRVEWHMQMWRVAGTQALVITKTNGRVIALFTGDPQGLLQAIERFRRGAA
jgi:hypothetical protein